MTEEPLNGDETVHVPDISDILPPMDTATILERLTDMVQVEPEVIVCALARYGSVAPSLRQALDSYLDGSDRSSENANLVFCGLHVMAGARDTTIFARLLRLFQFPEDEYDIFWGFADAQSGCALITSTFDGDSDALFRFITDEATPGLVAGIAFRALAFLTWDKRVELAATEAFLRHCLTEEVFEPDHLAWYNLILATALLGMVALEPEVQAIIEAGQLEDGLFELDDWRGLVEDAQRRPDDIARFEDEQIGYMTDVCEALGEALDLDFPDLDLDLDEDEDEDSPYVWMDEGEEPPAGMPAHNPLRHVGRNDPCPCGSGKKYKKCCLNG